jgi:hypothetical protein
MTRATNRLWRICQRPWVPILEREQFAGKTGVDSDTGRIENWAPANADELWGVARRTTRRAVVSGAVVGGATVAAGAYYGAGCVQVVNAYGQIITQCR